MSAVELVSQVVFLLCMGFSARLWFRVRTPQAMWSALTFGILGALVVLGFFLEEGENLPGLAGDLLIVVVLLLPWLLFRFADSVVPAGRRLRQVLDVVGIGAALSVFAIPSIPGPDDIPTRAQNVWIAVIIGAWLAQAVATTILLWRASQGQPGVTRGRLRMLAIGALLLGLSVTASAGPGSDETTQLISQLFSMAAGLTFIFGYSPPPLLRAAWRAEDERNLHAAAAGLLSAGTRQDIAAVLLPGIRALVGSPGVVAMDQAGAMIGENGVAVDLQDPKTRTVDVGPMRLALAHSPAMPLFGVGEQDSVNRLSLLTSLATERVSIARAEAAARATAEAANRSLAAVNAELESFVYTASHDLKNPIIAIVGYIEVLQQDHGAALNEEALHYLERMDVNARFMQSLIRDLLELSRVGRVDTERDHLDLAALFDAVTQDAIARHPETDIDVDVQAGLPDLWVNRTRMQQVIDNVIENSCRYSGRPASHIRVRHRLDDDGLTIDIVDDGIGIPPEQLERVFGMFERLDPGGSTGTGMGLAICHRIMESIGGSVVALPSQHGAHLQLHLPPASLAPLAASAIGAGSTA